MDMDDCDSSDNMPLSHLHQSSTGASLGMCLVPTVTCQHTKLMSLMRAVVHIEVDNLKVNIMDATEDNNDNFVEKMSKDNGFYLLRKLLF